MSVYFSLAELTENIKAILKKNELQVLTL